MASPRVFISYAHDSDDHQEAVRDLWILLRGCGIDARLDLPAAERRQDWPLWMLEQIRETDYVLVIASPAYRLRAEGTAAADEGRGVQFEAALLREELYRHRDAGMGKLLPVVLPGQSADNIPAYLGPTTATPLPGDRADPGGGGAAAAGTDQPAVGGRAAAGSDPHAAIPAGGAGRAVAAGTGVGA